MVDHDGSIPEIVITEAVRNIAQTIVDFIFQIFIESVIIILDKIQKEGRVMDHIKSHIIIFVSIAIFAWTATVNYEILGGVSA